MSFDGAALGPWDGRLVGSVVDSAVGSVVRCGVGCEVGGAGLSLGATDGIFDGPALCSDDGSKEGNVLGVVDGAIVVAGQQL